MKIPKLAVFVLLVGLANLLTIRGNASPTGEPETSMSWNHTEAYIPSIIEELVFWYADAQYEKAGAIEASGVQVSSGLRGNFNLYKFDNTQAAEARFGQLRNLLGVFIDYTGFAGRRSFSTSAQASSSLRLDDITFSGPSNVVDVALNLILTGGLQTSFPTPPNATTPASISEELQISGQISTNSEGVFASAFTTSTSSSGAGATGQAGSPDEMADTNGATRLSTLMVKAPVGVPIHLSLHLSSILKAWVTNSTEDGMPPLSLPQILKVTSTRSLRLPVGPPVFSLPAGYSVSSGRVSLSNNFYTPPLTLVRGSNGTQLTWPDDTATNLVLESTGSLVAPILWSEETNLVRTGTVNSYTAPQSVPYRFFRLRRTPR